MKNRMISGLGAVVMGSLIAFGPQFFFEICKPMANGRWMKCHWTGQAEIGVGLLIVALGVLLLLFSSEKVRLGLSLSLAFTGGLALAFPHALIGGCEMATMPCRKVAFPSLTVIGVLTVVGFAVNAFYLHRKRPMQVPMQVPMQIPMKARQS
ncbi:MAG: DUF4418 family protein [Synergistaceae bacterium]|nr:DUF4418 family protein [Synergistaceae bacterium]